LLIVCQIVGRLIITQKDIKLGLAEMPDFVQLLVILNAGSESRMSTRDVIGQIRLFSDFLEFRYFECNIDFMCRMYSINIVNLLHKLFNLCDVAESQLKRVTLIHDIFTYNWIYYN
jgi:hypothetical protein